jgi:hypothetical protein
MAKSWISSTFQYDLLASETAQGGGFYQTRAKIVTIGVINTPTLLSIRQEAIGWQTK